MRSFVIGLAAASLAVGMAIAQTATTPNTSPMTPAPAANSARPMTGNTPAGSVAASGNTNQVVATTSANASAPAKGKNSYTMNQARTRIQGRGYAQVADLKKDTGGVWRGKGQKDGASVDVWLDYKGNVGQQ